MIDEKRLRHWRWISETRGLHDNRVDLVGTLHQSAKDPYEIAPHGATDAAIIHLKDFFISVDHEVVIYAFLSEFVDNDGVALARAFR